MTYRKPILTEAEEAARRVLAHAYYGIHHVPYWDRRTAWGDGVAVSVPVSLSTYDYNTLTRLVVAAHDECVRVEILPGGRGLLKIGLTMRKREGDITEKHPTMEDAIVLARKFLS